MSDKDDIKELFQKELGNYEAKVDPNLWNGIQSGLSGATAAGGAASGLSIASKVIIGVVIATAATVSSVLIFSNEETKNINQAQVENKVKAQRENSDEQLVVDNKVDAKIEPNNTLNKELVETPTPIVEETQVDDNKEEINNSEVPKPKETSENTQPTTEETQENSNPKTETETVTVEKEEPTTEEKEEVQPFIVDISIEKQENQYIKLHANGENIRRIEWYFGDGKSSSELSPEHFYEDPGTFEVTAIIYGTDNKVEKSIDVTVEVEGKFTKLPNAFTPNNDGQNDEFFVEFEGISELQLNIFNKKQEIIFSTNDPNFKWRGYNSKGERVAEGEYVYVIIAKDKAGNVINKYKTLTVTR